MKFYILALLLVISQQESFAKDRSEVRNKKNSHAIISNDIDQDVDLQSLRDHNAAISFTGYRNEEFAQSFGPRYFTKSRSVVDDPFQQIGSNLPSSGSAFQVNGHSLAMNAAGDRLAIGAIGDTGFAGRVQVYSYSGSSWSQLGNDIDGDAATHDFGTSISMNDAGTIIVIGGDYEHDTSGSNAGNVKVYEYSSSTWSQIGADIDSAVADEQFGCAIGMNAAGDIIVVGAKSHDSSKGRVQVYKYSGSSWSQLGSDVQDSVEGDEFGTSVDINSAGDRIVVGAPKSSGGVEVGQVRVYEYSSNSWSILGSAIIGANVGDNFGSSVSINGEGDRVIAGSTTHSGSTGHARVFEYSSTSGWVQMGSDIDGSAAGDRFGYSVSINESGSRVFVGAPGSTTPGNGYVQVYEYLSSVWSQVDEVNTDDNLGHSVVANSDGTYFAAGTESYNSYTGYAMAFFDTAYSESPSMLPSSIPSSIPSNQPSLTPSTIPSEVPTVTISPSSFPSDKPSMRPSLSMVPSSIPSNRPSLNPSTIPSEVPTVTISPSSLPSVQPSSGPSHLPSSLPSTDPSDAPSSLPSSSPTSQPNTMPSSTPSMQPSPGPSQLPSSQPSMDPSSPPSSYPSVSTSPTSSPSIEPSLSPTHSAHPSDNPSARPTGTPSLSMRPSLDPRGSPSALPSISPTVKPTSVFSSSPSDTSNPSKLPTRSPSNKPTESNSPSITATVAPTAFPRCNDEADFLFEGNDCAWAAEATTSRCSKWTGSSFVFEHCRKTCNRCECADDPYWSGDKQWHSCKWVSNDADRRCGATTGAKEFCPTSCGQPCCKNNESYLHWGKKRKRDCAWVAKFATEKRCRKSKIAFQCPIACGLCNIGDKEANKQQVSNVFLHK